MSTGTVVALGEVMLRLKPAGFERFFQSPMLEATFGGAESNVVASLARFGVDAAFATALPNNPIADGCISFLRSQGVDTSRIVRQGERIGIYFLEAGANQRPSKVVYDRANSSMATAKPADFGWDEIFADASWFHTSGITPALSESSAAVTLRALQEAKARNITTSCDNNYRSKLWQYGKSAAEVMPELVRYVDVLIANEEDCRLSLGVDTSEIERGSKALDQLQRLGEVTFNTYPNLKIQAMTLRESYSASHNGWSACLYDGRSILTSRHYDIVSIVDRVGAGDAFTAGLIYGLQMGQAKQDALEFATAASCLKHSIAGDVNWTDVAEVEQLLVGDESGRVQR